MALFIADKCILSQNKTTIAFVVTTLYSQTMEITWDDRKEAENIKKHGVDFDEASTVILNPRSLFRLNNHSSGTRFEYIGHSDRQRTLFVVTVEKYDNHARIISAREAEPHERKKYEDEKQ